MFRTIVAGCNGPARGQGAVSLAPGVATATGAKLPLVGVHHNPPLPRLRPGRCRTSVFEGIAP
jgi:hypothetical protein